MIHALESILNDQELRKEKINKGFQQLSKFSWEKAALETKNVYEQVISR